MMEPCNDPYPGDHETAQSLFALAQHYDAAALLVLPMRKKKNAASWAPFRFLSLHAVELYLNAALLHRGQTVADIRGLKHDLIARTDFAESKGLNLEASTVKHLQQTNAKRAYVASRYEAKPRFAPACPAHFEEALKDVAAKVKRMLTTPPPPPPCPHCGHTKLTTRVLETA
ncbi:hypothetical protein [Ahrensia sp. R2A130]|uniref:hypothetical protein n=1 Tax=Ahrensia sp. R2A130 TaxID=744979 RepID=UPI0001E0A4B1|nr:hypothetical protein [Ahrensia sp. R2A130]EFL88403.1 conserved hypothetical protein [Ahrensia sp. R2A130]